MRHHTRAFPHRRHVDIALPVARRGHRTRPARARRSTRSSPSSTRRARPAASRARSCSTKSLELRTFESFPGLRHVIRELLDALADSPNRFVLTTRYVARAHRLLRDATARFEVMHLPPLQSVRRHRLLAPAFGGYEQMATDDRDYLGRAVQALTDGRAAYVSAHRRRDDAARGGPAIRSAP